VSGTANYPPVWRGRWGVNWSGSRYLASVYVNSASGSREVRFPDPPDAVAQPALAPWTTVDGQVGLVFDRGSRWSRCKLILSAENLLDRHPPLVRSDQVSPGAINFDSTNASAVGRFVTLQLMQAW
jgi:iron complex outermembrane recepter protein